MLILPLFSALTNRRVILLLIDAGLLVAMLCPVLWLLVVRPVQRLAHERGELLREQTSVQERERTRLARELHDELGQIQTAILLTAKAATQAGSLDVMLERVTTVHELSGTAIEATRRLARSLSPSVLEQFGLTTALFRLAEDCSVAGTVVVEYHDELHGARFASEVELCIYRAIQEALTNALKHAGAQRVTLSVLMMKTKLHFEVVDDGRGIASRAQRDSESRGLGLRSMRERVELLGGSLVIETPVGGGTRVAGTLPAEVVHRE